MVNIFLFSGAAPIVFPMSEMISFSLLSPFSLIPICPIFHLLCKGVDNCQFFFSIPFL